MSYSYSAGTDTDTFNDVIRYGEISASTATYYGSSYRIIGGSANSGSDSSNWTVQIVGQEEEIPVQHVSWDSYIGQNGQRYVGYNWGREDRHDLHEYMYCHGKRVPEFPTSRLLPLFEGVELEPRKCRDYLTRILEDEKYRKYQLKMIGAINRRMGLAPPTFNEDLVREELMKHPWDSLIFSAEHREELRRLEKQQMLKAQRTAEVLLRKWMPKEEQLKLESENRIELLAKNGKMYEILSDGRVNKLLPDGKKQGLCLVFKGGAYPFADVILAKRLMLENDPDMFEDIANKVSPFVLNR